MFVLMPSIELLEELHANTRRTRVTYRARVEGQSVALKCYRTPLWGVIHWVRAHRRGRRIRNAGAPFPKVAFSGWVPSAKCFGFGTEFLLNSESLRVVLKNASDDAYRLKVLHCLGTTISEMHNRGVIQPDGNLTNFLLSSEGKLWVIDEDDVEVYPGSVSSKVAVSNLANIVSRISSQPLRDALVEAYMRGAATHIVEGWDDEEFWRTVDEVRSQTEMKWRKRNISTGSRI